MKNNIRKTGVLLALMAIPAMSLMGCSQATEEAIKNDDINPAPLKTQVIERMTQTQAMTTPVDNAVKDNGGATQDTVKTPVVDTKSTVYKNGTYSAVGSYMSPAGEEQISVSLIVSNDVITGTSVEVKANHPVSANYQKMFADNYKQSVIGKSLASLNLDKVSGSSLTPQGFDDAVAKIKAQAKI